MKKTVLASIVSELISNETLNNSTEKEVVELLVRMVKEEKEENEKLKHQVASLDAHLDTESRLLKQEEAETKRLHWVLDQKEQWTRLCEDKLIAHGISMPGEVDQTNETTDLESGAPKLPGGVIQPEYSQGVSHLIDCLGVRAEHRLWGHLKCNDHSQDGRDDFSVWFEKSFYHANRESCKAFLAKLKDVALGRKSTKWQAWFQNDHLHLRRTG